MHDRRCRAAVAKTGAAPPAPVGGAKAYRWTCAAIAVLLAACSSDSGERVAATTLMGGALGIPGGPIGIGVGAGAGAVAGLILPKETIEGTASRDR